MKRLGAAGVVQWLREVSEEGRVVFRFGECGDDVVAEWPGMARLTCARDGRQPRLETLSSTPKAARLKIQSTVTAILRDLRGGVTMHGACIAVGAQALLLLGESGQGKSTTAAEFCLTRRASLLGDDVALLDARQGIVWVHPGEEFHFLSADSCRALGIRPRRGAKTLVPSQTVARRKRRLGLIAWLEFDDALEGPIVESLSGQGAFLCLLKSMIRFDGRPRSRDLEVLGAIIQQTRIIRIARPRVSPSVGSVIAAAISGVVHA